MVDKMKRAGKKGFELSIGFIVILIITIIIFASSLVVIRQIFSLGSEIQQTLSDDAKRNIEGVISRGQQVAVVPSLIQTERGKNGIVGVGFINTFQTKQKFYLAVGFVNAYDNDGKVLEEAFEADPEDMDKWILYAREAYILERSERNIIQLSGKAAQNIASDIRTPDGKYLFNVCVLVTAPNDPSLEALVRDSIAGRKCATDPAKAFGNKLYTGKPYKLTIEVD